MTATRRAENPRPRLVPFPAWRGYALALVTTAIAFFLRLQFDVVLEHRALMVVFVLPVMISAWYGGLGPGLFATALSSALVAYFFVAPYDSFAVTQAVDHLQLAIFAAAGAMISFLSHSLRDAKEQAERTARELRQRTAQGEVVARLGLFALEGHELDVVMREGARQVHEMLRVDLSVVLACRPGVDDLVPVATSGGRSASIHDVRVPIDGTFAGYTLRTREPLVIHDYARDGRFERSGFLLEHGVSSGISIAIAGPTGPYGVLGVHSVTKRAFDGDDVNFLQAVANVLSETVKQHHAEEELERTNERLEELVEERTRALRNLNEELESFNYSVAHDLRAPLRGIAGFSQVLLDDYGGQLDDTARSYLERIRRGGERLGVLIDSLLDLSRLSRGTLEPSRVDVSALAREVVERLREDEPDREVVVAVEDGLEAQADPRLVSVLLGNLLENAWKFTQGRAPARIEVGSRVMDGRTEFFVRDDGIGFDMAYANKLFVPFQRLHDDAAFEGTGVGLATVRRVALMHGGRAWATSEPGRGATFWFTLEGEEAA